MCREATSSLTRRSSSLSLRSALREEEMTALAIASREGERARAKALVDDEDIFAERW